MRRWFGLLLSVLLGLLIGLSMAPLLAGECMTIKQFYLGVVGNILAAVIVIGGFWALNFLHLRFDPVRKFFGIRSNTTFPIFIGHLANPNVLKGLAGAEELIEALELRSTLQSSIPGLGDVHLLRRLKLIDVETNLIVANPTYDYTHYLPTSFITIGSGGSNGMSKRIEDVLPVRVDFPTMKIKIGDRSLDSKERGVVVCRREHNHAWFYVAGQEEPDTAASARYLRQNWGQMFEKYPRGDFYYLLKTSRSGAASGVIFGSVEEDAALI